MNKIVENFRNSEKNTARTMFISQCVCYDINDLSFFFLLNTSSFTVFLITFSFFTMYQEI